MGSLLRKHELNVGKSFGLESRIEKQLHII